MRETDNTRPTYTRVVIGDSMLRDFQLLLSATMVVARGATVSNLHERIKEELPERNSVTDK